MLSDLGRVSSVMPATRGGGGGGGGHSNINGTDFGSGFNTAPSERPPHQPGNADRMSAVGDDTAGLPFDTLRAVLRSKFKEFICSFRAGNNTVLDYKEALQRNLFDGKYYLEVRWEDVSSFSEDVGAALRDHASQSTHMFEEVLREIAVEDKLFVAGKERDIQLQLLWTSNVTRLRDIGVESISHLLCIPGLVIKVGKTKLRCTHAMIQCQSCKSTISTQVGKDLELPKRCLSNTQPPPGTPPCRPNPYTLLSQSCEFEDSQFIKLQELPGDVPAGEMPRCMTVLMERALTDRVSAGSHVLVVAINSVMDQKKTSQKAVGLRSQFLRCVGLMPLQHDTMSSTATAAALAASNPTASAGNCRLQIWQSSDEKLFEDLAKRPTLYEDIAASIDPAVFGAMDIKKTITCLLFGGTRKRTSDGTLLRGDMNVLLMGDPSTAKSQLLKFVEKVAPVGLYTSGKGGSAAGLTAAVVRGEGGEWWLEAGSLVLADGGVVCIDEFDKMRLQDQVAIHEAMEQQTISLSKANISTVLNARCSVLAAANPMMGSFDPTKSDEEQISFQSSILSRFDCIFRLVDVKDFDRDVRIATHVMSLHKQPVGGGGRKQQLTGFAALAAAEAAQHKILDPSFLQKYIAFAKATCAPLIGSDAMEVLCNYFTRIRAEANNSLFGKNDTRKSAASYRSGGGGGTGEIHLTVRQLESLVRMTEALAKMHLVKLANASHAEEAIRLFTVSTVEASRAAQNGTNLSQVLTPQELTQVHKVEGAIRHAVTVGFGIKTARLMHLLETQGFEKKWVHTALYSMSRKGDVEFRNQRAIVFRKM
eukprot:PhM_4_TR8139/c0_g1_i1/m.69730/K02209/MCM5, CDC46; DNA replication licensing factor MCM5